MVITIHLDGAEESKLLERAAYLGTSPEETVRRALVVFLGLTFSAQTLSKEKT